MLKLSQRFGNSHQRFLGELELVRQSALRDFNELNNEKAVAIENLKRDKCECRLRTVHSMHILTVRTVFGMTACLEDVRDWDLLPDYLGGHRGLTLRQQTSTGPLTDVSSLFPGTSHQ